MKMIFRFLVIMMVASVGYGWDIDRSVSPLVSYGIQNIGLLSSTGEGSFDTVWSSRTLTTNKINPLDGTGVAGNVYTRFASSDSWGTATGGSSGGAYPEIQLQGYDFNTDGFTDTAAVTAVQFQQSLNGMVSSPTVTFLQLKGNLAGAVNYGRTQCTIPKSWTASDTKVYAKWGANAAASGQVYLHLLVSTSSLSGIYTLYDATNSAVNCTKYIENLVTSTFTISGLTAGQDVTLYIARPSDGCTNDIYLRSLTLGKD